MFRALAISLAIASVCSAQNWITVGEPGNPPLQSGPLAGRGTVDYAYQVADRPVNNREFVDFLNATGIPFPMHGFIGWLPAWDNHLSFDYLDGTFYVREGTADLPAMGMDWLSAARYANWLHTDHTSTEDGAYTLYGLPVMQNVEHFGWFMVLNQDALPRNPGARFWLPTHDDFVKSQAVIDNRIEPPDPGLGGGEWGEVFAISADCPHNKYECYPTTGLTQAYKPDGERLSTYRHFGGDYIGLRLHAPAEGVTLLGDADLDSDLDSADLLAFLGEWTGQQTPVLVPLWEGKVPLWSSRSDIDRDGDVDSNDLLGVLGNWTGASAQVPEPSGLVLGLLGVLYGLRASKPSRAFR